MTLEDFKEIHADDSPIRKLDLLLETMGNWRSDAVNRTDAKWRRNDEEVSYWDNEVKHMMNRSFWLYSELSNVLALQKPRVMNVTEVSACEVGTILWVEERQEVTWNLFPLEIETNSIHRDTGKAYLFFITYHGLKRFECDEYNQVWRCWTARPTNEQMEATAWKT